ncbi:armadillo-type protein [Ephemerocybe angulata]|uniref:Armadillo-type protein n=1 Tax=Ephemerocybe angulata TaxID=980116 RepID=A0A8H6MF04_9AGAR|nr:armadillo-type protein [Tulosesus angulatus]
MLREEREETKLWVRRAKEHRTAAEAGEDIIKELRTRIEALEKDPVVATQNSRATEGKQHELDGLLGQLSWETFELIADHIIKWANNPERGDDGRTLKFLANLFANLCQTNLAPDQPQVSRIFPPDLREGTSLWRSPLQSPGVFCLGPDPKCQAPGASSNRLFGELYMLKILDEHLMHECIKKLIAIIESNSDSGDAVQALHTLLSTIGTKLDTPQSRTELDIQFRRMKSISKGTQYSAHNRSLLQELLDLRKRKWVSLTEARVQSYKQLGFPSGSRTGSRLG